jgi:putative tricarboxylic transport membrane protein
MRFIASKDFLAGLMFVVFGGAGVLLGTDYRMGTAARMGPGYMPRMLCWALVALGAIVMINGILRHEPIEKGRWRPLVFITLAILLFAFLVDGATMQVPLVGWTLVFPKLGLLIAGALLIIVGSYGGSEFKPTEVVIATVVLLAASWGIFIRALGLPIAPLPG